MKRTKFKTRPIQEQGEFRESLKEIDWAWIAGFIDGEGYIGISKGYTENKNKTHEWSKERWVWYNPRINISNTDKESLEFILENFGGSAKVCKRKKYESNLRSLYTYEISNREDLRRIIPKLLPFLRIKKKQAQLVYRLVCLPRGSGPEKERIWQLYDKLIRENGQKAVGERNHKR